MTARAHRILKVLAAIAMVGTLSACAVHPAGGYRHHSGYYGRPYTQAPAYGGWRGGYAGGYGGYGYGYGNRYRGWR